MYTHVCIATCLADWFGNTRVSCFFVGFHMTKNRSDVTHSHARTCDDYFTAAVLQHIVHNFFLFCTVNARLHCLAQNPTTDASVLTANINLDD